MLRSRFTFLRGSARLMAYDLAATPSTGLRVQACRDCHLLNFGRFATPERNLVFDINDFDETLPAPWEWSKDWRMKCTDREKGGRDVVPTPALVGGIQLLLPARRTRPGCGSRRD
jgi:hypothetical protein